MQPAPRKSPESSRERLLAVAEILIADQGVSVALRDIAVGAGQRNNSAVQYYFGDRDGLLTAVIEHRLRTLEVRRVAFLANSDEQGLGDDPHVLVRTLVLPMVELTTEHGVLHYARFLEQVRAHPAVRRSGGPDGEHNATVRTVVSRLARGMKHLDPAGRDRRLESMSTVMFALLADRERALEAGEIAHDGRRVDELVAILVAMLYAPASASVAELSSVPDRPRGSPRGGRRATPRRS